MEDQDRWPYVRTDSLSHWAEVHNIPMQPLDIVGSRFALVPPMEGPIPPGITSYYLLERSAENVRGSLALDWGNPIAMWLEAIDLLVTSFERSQECLRDPQRHRVRRLADGVCLRMLAVAGSNSKVALDLVLDGYVPAAAAILRSMLEASYRVFAIQSDPKRVIEFRKELRRQSRAIAWPSPQCLTAEIEWDYEQARAGIESGYERFLVSEQERAILNLVSEAATQQRRLNFGAHASIENTAFLRSGDDMQFGPVLHRQVAGHLIDIGIAANLILLTQLSYAIVRSDDWLARLHQLGNDHVDWSSVALTDDIESEA